MVGILIISHCTLGESMKDTVALIIGPRENVGALALNKNDKVEHFSESLKKAVEKLDAGDGVLIFADMLGGTPCNAAMALYMGSEKVRVITGFNLPVVIEAIMHSNKPLDELAGLVTAKSGKTILDAKDYYKKR